MKVNRERRQNVNNQLEFQRYLARRRGQTADRIGEINLQSILDGIEEWLPDDDPPGPPCEQDSASQRIEAANVISTLKERGFPNHEIVELIRSVGWAEVVQLARDIRDAARDAADSAPATPTQPRRYCWRCGAWNYAYPDPCPVCTDQLQIPGHRDYYYCILCGARSQTCVCAECARGQEQ